MAFLLDTCFLSELTKSTPDIGVVDWLSKQSPDVLFISVMTIGEMRHGIARLPSSKKKRFLTVEVDKFVRLYSSRLLNIDAAVVHKWAELRAHQERVGSRLPVIDSLIAATALQHDLTVVT